MGLWSKCDDMIVHEEEPYNAEPSRRALAGRLVTPIEAFYSRNHGPVPSIDADEWRLRVDGLVDRELVLTLADLRERFETRELLVTLQCAGNRRAGLIEVRDIPGEDPWGAGATSNARWTGVSLADVLGAAGIGPDAAHVAFVGADLCPDADPPQPFGGSVGRAKALAGETLLAWAMNGQPLPAVHGGPVRVVVPGYIGARSVKWVERITAQTEPSSNYFQASAYRLLPAGTVPRASDEAGIGGLRAAGAGAGRGGVEAGAGGLRAGGVTAGGAGVAGRDDGASLGAEPGAGGMGGVGPGARGVGAAGRGEGVSLGAIAVNSEILVPDEGERLAVGPVTVSGYALAGDGRGIARVDVSIDGGATWTRAGLDDGCGRWAWCHWHATVHLAAGETEIVARACDTAGSGQPEHARDVWNPKGYVNNSWPRVHISAS